MGEDQDLPIALRRTPRSNIGGRAGSADPRRSETANRAGQISARTPSKPRSKKRVRFSDPGPEIKHRDDASSVTSSSTGLTPMVRRTSLGVAPSPKRRRRSTPLPRLHGEVDDEEDELCGDGGSSSSTISSSNEVRFLSLRQVLDDRVKRRIRRNGLSEEMNVINEGKRRRAQEQRAEVQRLRDELAQKDGEIEKLHNTTTIHDTDRILELEREIESLKSELSSRAGSDSGGGGGGDDDQTQGYDWALTPREPYSDSYMGDDYDTAFGDATMADLVCSTPSKKRRSVSGSFPTPPCTSPTIPDTPCSIRRGPPMTPQSHIAVQASLPDPEKEALEAELGSLRVELTKLTEALESHAAFKARIADKITAAQAPMTEPEAKDRNPNDVDVEAHLDSVLQALSDRTAALLELNSSLSSLGFAGRDAGEIVSSLVSAFRSARLELEYLTPGEIALPLSSRGAEVLDLMLNRLRDLARRVREGEDAVDEYHALELSLRQQLGARVGAMDDMKQERERDQSQLREKNERIKDLEVGIERLKGAAEGYRRDIGELETLVQKLEDEGRAAEARLQAEVDGPKAATAELETKLAAVRDQTETLKTQLARKAAEIRALNKYHGTALAVRDARVLELRRGLDGVRDELHEAHATIQRLRVENVSLGRRVEDERKRAAQVVVDSVKAELERVLSGMSSGSTPLLGTTPRKGEASADDDDDNVSVAKKKSNKKRERDSSVGVDDDEGEEEKVEDAASTTPDGSPRRGSYLSGELAKTGKGKKRRRYDSGLGFMDEDEDGSVDLV
ncbi:hypothetical protein AAE478_010241 [Parahypoxylon ruwenzoriense]